MENINQTTILVTGAAGFIGFHLCQALVGKGKKVIGLDNINDYYDIQLKYDRLKELGIRQSQAEIWNKSTNSSSTSNFTFVRMNLEDRENLPQLFRENNIKIVINLAAQAGVRYSLENPEAYVDSNIVGFLNILEACRYHQIKHLVFASSSSVYGANKKIPFEETDRVDFPVSLYAATKKSSELMAYTYSHLYQLPVSGLRFFTVYGPYGRPDMAPMLFTKAMMQNQPIKVFNNGNMSRDFTYIDDIIDGIMITLNHPPQEKQEHPYYQLFNIGNGAPISLMNFIETLEKHLDTTAKKNFMEMQPGDVPQTWADITAINKLGYKSTITIDEGIGKFVIWYKKYFRI